MPCTCLNVQIEAPHKLLERFGETIQIFCSTGNLGHALRRFAGDIANRLDVLAYLFAGTGLLLARRGNLRYHVRHLLGHGDDLVQ
jgi:hypothetical protein